GSRGLAAIEDLADADHRVEELPRPPAHRNRLSVAPQGEPGLPAAPRHGEMILVERALLGVADRRTLLHEAEREERLEEAQLVLVDAHRVEGADVERAHFHVLHPGAAQRLGGALAGASHTLRPDEAVVLVL